MHSVWWDTVDSVTKIKMLVMLNQWNAESMIKPTNSIERYNFLKMADTIDNNWTVDK